MIKLVYDKGNCVDCPPEMGCMGRACPQCWETHMFCDVCKQEADDLWRDNETDKDMCEECRDKQYIHIDFSNAGDMTDETDFE